MEDALVELNFGKDYNAHQQSFDYKSLTAGEDHPE